MKPQTSVLFYTTSFFLCHLCFAFGKINLCFLTFFSLCTLLEINFIFFKKPMKFFSFSFIFKYTILKYSHCYQLLKNLNTSSFPALLEHILPFFFNSQLIVGVFFELEISILQNFYVKHTLQLFSILILKNTAWTLLWENDMSLTSLSLFFSLIFRINAICSVIYFHCSKREHLNYTRIFFITPMYAIIGASLVF